MSLVRILAFETSCDETSVAYVVGDASGGSLDVLYHRVFSQTHLHSQFGGVVPELASRVHSQRLPIMLREIDLEVPPDYIAVTASPGLTGSLMVGAVAASLMASYFEVPVLAIDHLEGHIFANFVAREPEYPFLAMIVSGGHTEFVFSPSPAVYERVSSTIDDAVGEVFDKVARYAGLGYPGGPAIEKLCKGIDSFIRLPSPVLSYKELSFSGLKTAVIRKLDEGEDVKLVLASFQETVSEALAEHAYRLSRDYGVKAFYGAGGVMANASLRKKLSEKFSQSGIEFSYPPVELCVDNALMIATTAFYRIKWRNFSNLNEVSAVSMIFD